MYFFNLCVIQALRYLGFSPTEEEQHELRQRLPVDRAGLVSYGGKSLKNKRTAFYIFCSIFKKFLNARLFTL